MKKRIIASALAVVLCMSLLPYEVFANLQSPIKGISDNSIVEHTNDRGRIRPEVELMFEEPAESEFSDPTPGAVHEGGLYYHVKVEEYPNGKDFNYPEYPKKLEDLGTETGQTLRNGIKVQGLDNGRLYKMSIIPNHYHLYPDEDGDATIRRWAPRTPASDPFEYVLTDFDTLIEGKGGSLEVTWEDSGFEDMDYQIGYIQGNYEGQSLDSIRNNNTSNNINYITSTDIRNKAEKYQDPQTGRTRFRYTIEDNIATGQMYSAYVVSMTDKIDNKDILQNKKTPKVVTATTELGLDVYNSGKDRIRLEWDAKLIHVTDGSYELQQTQIMEYAVGQESGRVIATLHGKDGADIGYYEYREPKESTYYQLIFIYKHVDTGLTLMPEPQTEKVLYVPGELRTKPATPQIPKPIGPNTKVDADNKDQYLLPGDVLVDVPLIDLWKNDHTFHANMLTPPNLNFVWSAYKEDLSLLYDIWVSDDISIVRSDTEPLIGDLSFSSGQNADDILYNRGTQEIVGFKHTIREYYDSEMNTHTLVPNKVYYVKIVAKKKYGNELEPSLPSIVTIMFDSDGEVFAPPVISKPPLKIDSKGISTTSVTIGWLETWYEIMAKDYTTYPVKEQEKAKQWNAKVYTGATSGPAISFVPKEGTNEYILETDQKVQEVKNIVERIEKGSYIKNYMDRMVNLGKDVSYEYKYMPYDDILRGLESYNSSAIASNKKTVEEYIEMLMRDETDPEEDYGWTEITPSTVEDDGNIQWRQHTQDNLKPNTSYVFFVKPFSYDYDGTKLQAALPTWIVGTTLPDGEMEEGIPIVPRLSLNNRGDTHLAVEWEYNSAFDYELVYSRLDDPERAIAWPFEISTEVEDSNYVEHGGRAVVTIDGLFPDTTYNIWIRAKQKKGIGISDWSNPVTATTHILGVPTAPSGLGVASYHSILEVGRDFKAVDSNHITVEWERNAPDKDLDNIVQDNQRVQKEYRYVIELADNSEFIDKQQVVVGKDTVGSKEGDAEILSRTMVYFDKLIANRPYYVRAKTVLIATDQENNREIVVESDYTQFVRIITKESEEEYDGGDKMNEVIYPDKIKETYDGTTWIYEILDTQKVINEMVTGNQFRYVVQVQKYRDKHDPKYRVIRIPQPVVQTLINRRMELEIRTNILSIQIPVQALEAYMQDASSDGMVEFTFEKLDVSEPHLSSMGYDYGFLSRPEKMSIILRGQRGIVPLTKIDALMKVKINMPYQGDYAYRNLGGYTFDTTGGVWKKGNHQFDKENMRLEYTTGIIGTYAVYEKTRIPSTDHSMSLSMNNVVNKYDIVGLGTSYKANMHVGISEYINIVLGIAEKKTEIKPHLSPTGEEQDRARNAGLYIGRTSQVLTQEAAISGAVRLYELTHGISIRPETNNSVSDVTGIYQENIKKAYTVGLINYIDPKQLVTYKDLFDLIEQVIE